MKREQNNPSPSAAESTISSSISTSISSSISTSAVVGAPLIQRAGSVIRIAEDDGVRRIYREAIDKWGPEEWRAVLLTNEIHGHIGIYSTLGAKMGILVKELASEELRIVSYAGLRPPVSCFNDGLQISTGATLGHGSIEVAGVTDLAATTYKQSSLRNISYHAFARPEAHFYIANQSLPAIKLRLKSDYLLQIQSDISQARKEYGSTKGYWERVRQLALKYWLEWDRHIIFEEC